MDIYNKTTYSKRYVQFTLNKPLHSLTNISFSLARGYVPLLRGKCKRKTFSKTDKQILKQKYTKLLIRDSILKAKGLLHEFLRRPKMRKFFLSILHTIPTMWMFFLQ